MTSTKTDEALVRDFHHVWHPCTQMKDHELHPPLLVERAKGIYLYDEEGNSYLDVISSWWVNLFGHNHPRLNEALKAQLEKFAHVMFAGITHQPAVNLAEKLVELTPPDLTRVFFSDNGSTSIEVALKMSLQYWLQTGQSQKTRFIHLKDAYHGETLGALSVCGTGMFREKFEAVLMPNLEVAGPDCYRCPYGLQRESCSAECFEPMEQALEAQGESVAGVIVEPLVQGAAGMKMYPPVYLKKLERACREKGVHTIYDEVAVAFYRTGSLFVCGGHELNPTFLCLSKGITSGYLPLAVTLTEEKVFQAFYDDFSSGNFFIHSHSYSANPLACALANETLGMLTEKEFEANLPEKIESLGRAGERLKELPWCGEFRQTGMIGALELVRNPETKEPFRFDERVGFRIFQEGLKRGLFLRPLGNVVYFIPPLVIQKDEILAMIDSARESIRHVLSEA